MPALATMSPRRAKAQFRQMLPIALRKANSAHSVNAANSNEQRSDVPSLDIPGRLLPLQPPASGVEYAIGIVPAGALQR